MINNSLINAIHCPICNSHIDKFKKTCFCKNYRVRDNIICSNVTEEEMHVRDSQASGYLQHSKLPVQVHSFLKWFTRLKQRQSSILELGCGPGPYTSIMSKNNLVLGVDFSKKSLEINSESCSEKANYILL